MENESLQAVKPALKQVEKSKPGFIRRYPVLVTAFLGIIAVAIVFFWKDMQAKKEKAAIIKLATEQILQNSDDMLRLVTKPFVWSIRAEMLRDNLDQVNSYTKEMVREKNFQQIHIVDPTGKIVISTDKKLEGQLANEMFTPAMLQTDSIMSVKEGEMLSIVAPVMGYDRKLGVLIMNYLPAKFKMDLDKKVDTTGSGN